MPERTKLQQQTIDFTSAWDERKRTFDALRKLDLSDDELTTRLQTYIAAARHFDELRHKLIKP